MFEACKVGASDVHYCRDGRDWLRWVLDAVKVTTTNVKDMSLLEAVEVAKFVKLVKAVKTEGYDKFIGGGGSEG